MHSTGSYRAQQIKDVWRERPKGNLFDGTEIVRLYPLPEIGIQMPIMSEKDIVMPDKPFEFRLETSRGVNLYGRPQTRQQIICEGIVLEERFI